MTVKLWDENPCTECKGTGRTWEYTGELDIRDILDGCKVCGGTGEIRKEISCSGCVYYLDAWNFRGLCCVAGVENGVEVNADFGCKLWEKKND